MPLSSRGETLTIAVELPLPEGVTPAGWTSAFFIVADPHNKFAERNDGYVPPEVLAAVRAKLKPLLGTGPHASVSFIRLSGGFAHQV